MRDEFYSLTGKLKNISKSLYSFSFVGGRLRLHVPWGRNLSSADIAKCEPQVFRLGKTLKSAKTSKTPCFVPRRLSFDENVREKESVPFPWSIAVYHQSLAFRARLCNAKNEAPEEEAEKRRSACVWQAHFGKLELNNIRKDSGNSKRLSGVNVINLKHDQLEINVAECSDLRTFMDGRENYYPWPF